jgi:hypothetical protein
MHDIATHCAFVQLKELKRQMAAQRPVPQPEEAPERVARGAGLVALLRRLRFIPARLADDAPGA